MRKIKFALLLLPLMCINLFPQALSKSELNGYLKKNNAALVIFDAGLNKTLLFNSRRCAKRIMPASTYKIPNAMIGLETGVIPDSDYVIKWDGKPKPVKEWERDHTLKSAIYYSVVPYFRELARGVGREKMQYWLNKINYGNKTIGIEDYFWLDNSLKISAVEQVKFLRNFYYEKLPFSKRSIEIVKNILPEEDYKNGLMKWKTGTGDYEPGKYVAWLVGYVVKRQTANVKRQNVEKVGDSNIYFFAFNVDAKTFDDAVEMRSRIKSKMLDYLGIDR